MRFNLSRPHSSYDHRRTCAVIGCKNKAVFPYTPLCRIHGNNPEVIMALMNLVKEKS